ncbi:MAG TPA: F0F1 ATP synthase subunit delta [Candidatus Limnocylindrales bacterium]|nr:F0F1 ATP synthase subunit delta [Candidatus Limnocylindrales bacterium]
MKVPRHILAKTIAERTLNIADSKLLAREIAAYLLTERRTAELESILRDVMQYRAGKGAIEAELVTAHDVSQHVVDDVKQLLGRAYPKAKTVHVSPRTDASVIGGLRVDMANEQLDMTIGAKLATLKRFTAVDKE